MWGPLLIASLAWTSEPGVLWQRPVPGAPPLRKAHEEVFRKFDVDYLRVAFYVDASALKRRPRGQGARAWVLKGRTWCGRRSTVLQEIGGARRAEGLKAQLEAHWPEGPLDPERPAVKRLLASAAGPLELGDRIDYVWDPSGRIHIRLGRAPWLVLSDALLHQALLRIAFGNAADPGTPALEQALEALAPTPARP
ncbi:MAG TPA: hypothetical protein VJ570_13020 [Holophagaceae bacterium]|nr:hypothetical protein [Holophagaceae bacterium]